MPSKTRKADDERIQRKHKMEAAQKAPLAIILNVSTETDEGDRAYQALRKIFGRILIFSYSLPLNGKTYEFEKMSKEANYFLIIGDVDLDTPDEIKQQTEINRKLENIVKANYELLIIKQTNLEFPALARKRVTEIKSIDELKKILS